MGIQIPKQNIKIVFDGLEEALAMGKEALEADVSVGILVSALLLLERTKFLSELLEESMTQSLISNLSNDLDQQLNLLQEDAQD